MADVVPDGTVTVTSVAPGSRPGAPSPSPVASKRSVRTPIHCQRPAIAGSIVTGTAAASSWATVATGTIGWSNVMLRNGATSTSPVGWTRSTCRGPAATVGGGPSSPTANGVCTVGVSGGAIVSEGQSNGAAVAAAVSHPGRRSTTACRSSSVKGVPPTTVAPAAATAGAVPAVKRMPCARPATAGSGGAVVGLVAGVTGGATPGVDGVLAAGRAPSSAEQAANAATARSPATTIRHRCLVAPTPGPPRSAGTPSIPRPLGRPLPGRRFPHSLRSAHAPRRRAARVVRPLRSRLLVAAQGLPRGRVQGAARRAATAVLQGVGLPRLAVPHRSRLLRARPPRGRVERQPQPAAVLQWARLEHRRHAPGDERVLRVDDQHGRPEALPPALDRVEGLHPQGDLPRSRSTSRRRRRRSSTDCSRSTPTASATSSRRSPLPCRCRSSAR